MSNQHLGVSKALELLDSLKETVRGFAEKEDRLARTGRSKTSSLRRSFEEALEAGESRLSEELRAANASFQSKKGAIVEKFERRSAWISEAYKTSRDRLLAETEAREGRRKIQLQSEALDSHRGYGAAVADAEALYQEFRIVLAEDGAALDDLEKKAKRAFGGYGEFVKRLAESRRAEAQTEPASTAGSDVARMMERLRGLTDEARESLRQYDKSSVAKFFRFVPASLLTVLVIIAHAALGLLLHQSGHETLSYGLAGVSLMVFLVLIAVLHLKVKKRAEPAAAVFVAALAEADALRGACAVHGAKNHQVEIARIKSEHEALSSELDREWNETVREASGIRSSRPEEIDAQASRISARHEELYRESLERLEPGRENTISGLEAEAARQKKELEEKYRNDSADLESELESEWTQLGTDWKMESQRLYDTINGAIEAAEEFFPDWNSTAWDGWAPPHEFRHVAKFGVMEVRVPAFTGAVPEDERLKLPGSANLTVPLLLALPEQGSILFETREQAGHDRAIDALNNIILRFLSVAPPGRLSFTIVDPVGLGENFAGIMHLADYEEQLINSRIWTQTTQIEQRLGELNEHMEKVIQMYLRNDYETITQYNEQAGNIAEKYHFLVVADFPSGFSEIAVKRLLSITSSGARCGVYTLIHWDRRQPLQDQLVEDELRASSVWFDCRKNGLALSGEEMAGMTPILDAAPAPDFAVDFVHKIGKSSIDSNRVEVPFPQVAPQPEDYWSSDTTKELRVPIGRTGATKLQYLAIGKGTCQHALIAGKTGSGKSTLFHVIITNLSLWCSPEQVEFYLVDFKKGVEFKAYATARLPHARVIAIESDREFGLSVLQRVDEELKRRGDMFRELGVQDVEGYKKAGGIEPMPRSLLIIDEFQEFFVEDDRISQNAAVLLDRIVRQGRAFGIHALLGSQTLGGAFTLARTTLGQMVIRIALQCNEADAYLIMDDSNPAPRMLTRPGEGIYNDSAGSTEGNSPFQVVWLPDDIRENYLNQVRELAVQKMNGFAEPIVFEGNVPGNVRDNAVLRKMLELGSPPDKAPSSPRAFLGAPNSIKGPTEAVFHRQSGNNLLLVGQRDESALAIVAVSLISLAAQYPAGKLQIILIEGSPPNSPEQEFIDRVITAIPHELKLVKGHEIDATLAGLGAEMAARSDDPHAADAPAMFLFVLGLQKFKKLRFEEDFSFSMDTTDSAANPGIEFDNLIRDGASLGIHVVATCDTYNNVNRYLSRKALTEFEMRVLFQMSANDSASLIDTPKASTLGMNRALFYNEQEGYLETFRPYAQPGKDWLEEAGKSLAAMAE